MLSRFWRKKDESVWPRRVMIVMPWGRVGSNMLMAYMGGFKPARLGNEALLSLRSVKEQLDWLQDFFYSHDSDSVSVICTKESLLRFEDPAAIEAFILENDVAIIRMFRRDVVRTAISQIRANQFAGKTAAETGQAIWGVRQGEPKLGITTIDIAKLDKNIATLSSANERLLGLFLSCRYIDIFYEDMAADIDQTMNRVSDFLGLERRKFAPPFEKATPESLWEVIENRDEVAAYLAAKGFKT